MRKLGLIITLVLISLFCFGQSRYVSQSTKKIVFTRDGGKCQCCGLYNNLEYDHIQPYSCGGGNQPSNIQLLCLKCNRSKSNSCYCKIHNKKIGANCCQGKTPKSGTSAITTRQCSGTTQKGLRCKNRTKNRNGRCHHHQKRK